MKFYAYVFLFQILEEQLRSFEYMLAKNAKMACLKDLDHSSNSDELFDEEGMGIEENSGMSHALSVPDLAIVAQREIQMPSDSNTKQVVSRGFEKAHSNRKSKFTNKQVNNYFARNARFGSGTMRVLRNRLANASTRLQAQRNTLYKPDSNKEPSPFKRFGSLQNLKSYQNRNLGSSVSQRPFNGLSSLKKASSNGTLNSLSSLKYIPANFNLAEMQEKRSIDSLELESRMGQYWHGDTTCF